MDRGAAEESGYRNNWSGRLFVKKMESGNDQAQKMHLLRSVIEGTKKVYLQIFSHI